MFVSQATVTMPFQSLSNASHIKNKERKNQESCRICFGAHRACLQDFLPSDLPSGGNTQAYVGSPNGLSGILTSFRVLGVLGVLGPPEHRRYTLRLHRPNYRV